MITEQPYHFSQTISFDEEKQALAFSAKEVSELVQKGLLKIVLPNYRLSFTKKNTPQLLQLLKAVGRKNLSLGRLYEGHINALLLIHLFGTEQQKKNWYACVEEGYLFGVWNTGNAQPVTISYGNENNFILSGKKTFASGAGLVRCAVVTGNLYKDEKDGWQMCIVNAGLLPDAAIDYNSWKPMGMKHSISYTVDFTGYRGNTSDLLGMANDYYKQPVFSAGAIRFCAVQLGGAEAIFNLTTEYLQSLKRTEDTFQQARIAQMATELTSGDLWIHQAAQNWDNWNADETKKEKLIAFVNMTRTSIERICLQVIELSSQCVGARGLLQGCNIEQKIRDLQFYLRQPAPDAAITDVAKYVVQSRLTIEALWHEDRGME